MSDEKFTFTTNSVSGPVVILQPQCKMLAQIKADGKIEIYWEEVEKSAVNIKDYNHMWSKLLLHAREQGRKEGKENAES